MTADYSILGKSPEIQQRRLAVLDLYLQNYRPWEMAEILDLEQNLINRDIKFLRSIKLYELPLERIKDMGVNFFEMKVREYTREIASYPPADRLKNSKHILDLEDKLIKCKIESLKIQGVYADGEPPRPGPITIVFEEVEARHGKYTTEQAPGVQSETPGRQDKKRKEKTAPAPDYPGDIDPEKEYPRY